MVLEFLDLIQEVLNLVVPPLSIATMLFILPWYLFFKYILTIIKSVLSENVTGKAVLITGASSGIGEVNFFTTKHFSV